MNPAYQKPATNYCVVIFLLFLFSTASITSYSQVIYTLAGGGQASGSIGSWGDGGVCYVASTAYPSDVCLDTAGNIYLTCVNCVRKIDAVTHIITTIAGNNNSSYSGDNGPAVNASMRFPIGLCTDKKGHLFIAEYGGHVVRQVNLETGIITTVAGNGTPGYSGDGDSAIKAQLNTPQDIAADDFGNLYIADYYNSCIRKVDLATGIISTFATGYYPGALCFDNNGTLYSAQIYNVYRHNMATGASILAAGNGQYAYSGDGGLATDASLNSATGICIDTDGDLYIAEYDDSRIRKVDHATGIINTIAGTGVNGFSGDGLAMDKAQLYYPKGIVIDKAKGIYVCDNNNHRIRKIDQLRNTWIGGTDNNWENPLNWASGKIPTENMDVEIYSGNVVINSNIILNSLTVGNGASLTVSGNYSLTITHIRNL